MLEDIPVTFFALQCFLRNQFANQPLAAVGQLSSTFQDGNRPLKYIHAWVWLELLVQKPIAIGFQWTYATVAVRLATEVATNPTLSLRR